MNLGAQKILDRVVGGAALVVLKPFVVLAGATLRRDHGLEPRGKIVFMKMLGGGSLVIALPALLGIRKRYPNRPMWLVTTAAVAPFARTLGVFDEIVVIDSRGVFRLFATALGALVRAFRADTFVDLEVYSKLTTVFSLLTCARNRIGFYLESALWRRPIHTHLIFFNRAAPVALFYDRVAALLGASPATREECERSVRSAISADKTSEPVLVMGVGCSSLSRERMLSAEQWLQVFAARWKSSSRHPNLTVCFLGGPEDAELSEELARQLRDRFPGTRIEVACGKSPLAESLRRLARAVEFWGIDSSLLHYARLFQVRVLGFWGPTSPRLLVRASSGGSEEHFYAELPCSPCVHVAEEPPCEGKNLCITESVRQARQGEPPVELSRREMDPGLIPVLKGK